MIPWTTLCSRSGPAIGRVLAAPAVAAAVVACGAPDVAPSSSGPWEAVVETRNGTQVVRTISGAVWQRASRLELDVSIGAADGLEEAYLFGTIDGLAVTQDTVVVVDGQLPAIREFSLEGEYLGTIGFVGEGPGGYVRPGSVAVDGANRIFVRDWGMRRISVYDDRREVIATYPLGGAFMTTDPIVVLGGVPYTPVVVDHSRLAAGQGIALAGYGPRGALGDILTLPQIKYDTRTISVAGPPAVTAPVPYAPVYHWAVSSEGDIAYGVGDAYQIHLVLATGEHRIIEFELPPVPIRDEERDYVARYTTGWIRAASDPNWQWSGPTVPVVKPAFAGLKFGMDNNLWVVRPTESQRVSELCDRNPEAHGRRPGVRCWTYGWVAHAFDRQGRFLGEVALPSDLRTRHGGYSHVDLSNVVFGERVIFGEAMENDVAYVRRYRRVSQ